MADTIGMINSAFVKCNLNKSLEPISALDQPHSSQADPSPARAAAEPTTLSDISEDNERHFTQHERRRRRGAGESSSAKLL